jgi:hypothetical protein
MGHELVDSHLPDTAEPDKGYLRSRGRAFLAYPTKQFVTTDKVAVTREWYG